MSAAAKITPVPVRCECGNLAIAVLRIECVREPICAACLDRIVGPVAAVTTGARHG